MSRVFKKKNEFSKTMVILDISLFIIYITINIIMQWTRGFSMPSDINVGVFAFLTGELGLLSFIKRSKLTAETAQCAVQNAQSAIKDISTIQNQVASMQQTQQNNINYQQGAAG